MGVYANFGKLSCNLINQLQVNAYGMFDRNEHT